MVRTAPVCCLLMSSIAWLAAGVAASAGDLALLVWSSFETSAEVAKWRTLGTSFEQSTRFATEGQHSARLHFRRYAGAPGEAQWPRVTAFNSAGLYPPDWTKWAAVAVDLTTDAPAGVEVSLEIRDTLGKNGWYARYSLQPQTTQRVTVPLSAVAKVIDASHIAEVLLFKGRPEADVDVYVDNVRLISPSVFEMMSAVDRAAEAFSSLWTRQGGCERQKAELASLRKDAASSTLTIADAERIEDRARQLSDEIVRLRIKPLRAFDFGPAGSPVREGFVGVATSTVFPASQGYGWLRTEGLKELTRPVDRKWTMSYGLNREVPPVVYLNDLTQDLVGGTSPAEFAVEVPPGDYTLWLLAGFPTGYEPIVSNFVVNAGAGDQRIGLPQQHIFASQFIPANAGQQGLVVRFIPETGFVVNALAVFKREDLRRARKEFGGPIDQEVFRLSPELWSEWKLVPHALEKPAPPPSAEEQKRGYVLFARPFVQNVYPDSQPQANERFRRLEALATPGEYEPFVFSIQALRDLDGVTLEVGALAGPAGSRIPTSSLDARQVRCWAVRTHYSAVNTYKIVPEILDPVVPTDLDANTCQRFWLTVHVPDDARPGFYEGQAIVKADNAPASRVGLRLEVLPFRLLRDPTKSFGNYYYSPLDKISPNMSAAVVEAIRKRAEAEARDMQEHGMNTLQMGGIGARKANGQWEATINLDERIQFLRRFGLWGQAPGIMMSAFFVGGMYRDFVAESWRKHLIGAKMPPQAYFDAVSHVIEQVEKERLARGWPDFYYYPIDEAAQEAIPILAKTLAAIKKVPTAKTYATQIFELPESRPLDEVLDVWCSGWFCKDLAAVEAMRKRGRIFWCYPNFVACSRGVPNSARMTYGFGLWRMGYSCLIPWHYQAPASGSNPFCDFDGTYGDWCLAYPGAEGPIPTQRWESIREGIDDGRYLYTLEARIAEAEKRGTAPKATAVGEALLKEIRDAVPVQSTYEQEGPWKGPEYEKFRRRLAEAILAIAKDDEP